MIKNIIVITTILLMKTTYGQIAEGDKVPQFSLPDKNGNIFDLKDHLGKKNLVIYFYPKDETSGCTAEACAFRDNFEVFKERDAEVIGISADSPESHKKFAENHHLPYILLSDRNNEVRKLYGVPNSMLGIIPGRVTYVVDKIGIVRLVFNSQTHIDEHISKALKVLDEAK
jgi:thioredoxin-dependent peroxiredoxin